MANKKYGCQGEKSNLVMQQVQPEEIETCLRTFHQIVTGVAEVIVTPNIVTDDIRSHCIGQPTIITGEFPDIDEQCHFIVAQQVCTEVDLQFGADVDVGQTGLTCGNPGTGNCQEPPDKSCTFTHGYYKNHEEFTKELITDAGGSIILGPANQSGLTIVATIANANAILNHNPPAPAPTNPPFRNQYAILYAQLLTARLNVLRGATCKYVLNAIEDADTFIGESPIGGMKGAPDVQEPLDLFNNGHAPGCPEHC